MSEFKVFTTEEKLANYFTTKFLLLANNAISEKNKVVVGLSGGSVAKIFCEKFSNLSNVNPDFWKPWHFIFCDERHVPYDDKESTYGYYKKHFFDVIHLPSENVIKINPNVSVEESAKLYESEMRNLFGLAAGDQNLPQIDVLLLGVGPDGHTCSLFPSHPLLNEKDRWVAPIEDSPKPPPGRITLTYPIINRASTSFIIASGASKAPVVQDALENKESVLPIAKVRSGHVMWLIDQPASSLLPPESTRIEL